MDACAGNVTDVCKIGQELLAMRLTGKCLCVALKEKAASFFEPSQFGVACPNGAEKVIHGLRACIDKHWFDDDFGVLT